MIFNINTAVLPHIVDTAVRIDKDILNNVLGTLFGLQNLHILNGYEGIHENVDNAATQIVLQSVLKH